MIEILKEAGSTNAELLARLAAGERVPEGTWLIADRQTAGRGRQGREWIDGAGNFMGSTLVQLGPGDPDATSLSLVAGLALHGVIAPLLGAERASLKWPNDVLVGRAKVSGILLERAGSAVVVGIGVNLTSAPRLPERPSAALADFATPPGRDAFARDLAKAFDTELQRWRSYGLGPIIARWLDAAHPLGTPLVVTDRADERIAGDFAGLSADGALQLRLQDGTTRMIHAGEVHFAA